MGVLRYHAILEPGPRNWSISFPRFPGVVSTGSSVNDTIRQGTDALISVVDAMREGGRPLPPDLGQQEMGEVDDLTGYSDPRLTVIAIVADADVGARRAERVTPYDTADYLRDEADDAAFLAVAAEEDDPAVMDLARAAVARAARRRRVARLVPPTEAEDAAILRGIEQDPDNPEWTAEDFARARPASEVMPPELYAELLAAFEAKKAKG